MQRKTVLLTGIFVAGVSFLSPHAAQAARPPAPPQKVGVIIGLSGNWMLPAQEVRRGMELATSEPDTYPLELIFEDDQGMDPKAAAAATNKLINIDKVSVILNWVNTTMPALAPVANRSGIPVIEFWDHNRGMLNLGPFVFCSGASTELSVEKMARFIANGKGVKKLVVISANDPWSQIATQAFNAEYKKNGVAIIFETSVNTSEKDLRSIILRAKRAGANGVFAPIFYDSLYALIRQWKGLGLGGNVFTADGFLETDIATVGQDAEGVFSEQVITTDKKYIEAYQQRYKVKATATFLGLSALGYDGIKILSRTFNNIYARGEEITPSSIQKELKTMRYNGVTGIAVLSGQAEKVESIVVVKDGHFQKVEWE